MQTSKSLYLTSVICAFVLLMCSIFLMVQKRSLEKTLSIALQNANESAYSKQLAESKIGTLETYLMLSFRSNGNSIAGNISFIDIKNNWHTAIEIFAGKTPCLIFRYSYNDCAPCINTIFDYLWNLKNSVPSNKLRIIIMPHYTELRQMIVENTLSFKNQFTFYMTDERGLDLPIDEEGLPYLTVVDENRQVSNIFIVDMIFPALLENYFKLLIENYQ